MEKQLFTDKEMAAMLGCSWAHVKTLRLKRQIPFIKLGRLVRYNPQEVMKAIEKLTTRERDYQEEKKRSLEERKSLLSFGLAEKKRLWSGRKETPREPGVQ
jgi:excisionase family DNA binding protein